MYRLVTHHRNGRMTQRIVTWQVAMITLTFGNQRYRLYNCQGDLLHPIPNLIGTKSSTPKTPVTLSVREGD